MAKSVSVSKPHKTTKEAAVEKLRALTADVATKYGMTVVPNASGATVDGRGITGTCRIDDRNITIELELPFLLRALASKIEQGIHKQVDQHFA